MKQILVKWSDYYRSLKIGRTTAWRWRKAGILRPVRIRRRWFVTMEEKDRFSRQIEKGFYA